MILCLGTDVSWSRAKARVLSNWHSDVAADLLLQLRPRERFRVLVGENPTGCDAEHFVQSVGARIAIPVRGPMSIGMDFAVFLRNSYFSREDFVDTTQRVPQARLYLAWGMGK